LDTAAPNTETQQLQPSPSPDAQGIRRGNAVLPSGISLCWVESGNGVPLLLVHGGHGGSVHWSANLADLGQDHRVIAPDLPGFGESSDPGRCLTPEEHAHELVAWLARIDVPRVRVVGFSFGSLVALAFAIAHPAAVEALVLVNLPGVGPRSESALNLPQRMSTLAREQGQRAGIEGTLRELMLSNQPLVTPSLVDLMTVAARRTRYVTRGISRQSQTLELLARLRVRTAVLIGARDPFHSNDLEGRRRSIDGVLGAGATRVVADAAHWLQYDQPQRFADELRRFFHAPQKTKETT
jgi:2-hydroxy-6-oxonona-2,4-dienedioate hydrolase